MHIICNYISQTIHSMKFYLVIDLILQHRIALQIIILKEFSVHCICCSSAPLCITVLKNKPGLVLTYCAFPNVVNLGKCNNKLFFCYFYSIYVP